MSGLEEFQLVLMDSCIVIMIVANIIRPSRDPQKMRWSLQTEKDKQEIYDLVCSFENKPNE